MAAQLDPLIDGGYVAGLAQLGRPFTRLFRCGLKLSSVHLSPFSPT
jgi:hypothetical protein